LFFPLEKLFRKKFCQTWFKKKNVYILPELFQTCQLLQVLICECQKALMTFLRWPLTLWMKIANLKK